MAAPVTAEPVWCLRIRRLVEDLNLTQAALAERLGVSPATVSRWIQGKIEPTAEGYVALGNLAPRSEGVYFLERAGLDVSGFPDSHERRALSSLRVRLSDLKVITGKKPLLRDADAEVVAVPLLKIEAASNGLSHSAVSLADAELQDVVLVPVSWCPNPEHTVALHVADDAMTPAIPPKSILFVDTTDTERNTVRGSVVLVMHRDLGYRAGRLQRFGGTDLLMWSNPKYPPLDVSNSSRWKVCGRVLWWIARDQAPMAN